MIKKRPIPNLLFIGNSGVGKTSLARAIVKHIYPDEKAAYNYLELNASNTRSVEVIRETVIEFCNSRYSSDVSFVIMDECDNLTNEAQGCLRRIMELYQDKVCIILIANKLDSILKALVSRCTTFLFQNLSQQDFYKGLFRILSFTNLQMDEDSVKDLFIYTNGDLRRANYCIEKLSISKTLITSDTILKVFGAPSLVKMEEYFLLLANSKHLNQSCQLLDELSNIGIKLNYLFKKFLEHIIPKFLISESSKWTSIQLMKLYCKIANLLLYNQKSKFLIEFVSASFFESLQIKS